MRCEPGRDAEGSRSTQRDILALRLTGDPDRMFHFRTANFGHTVAPGKRQDRCRHGASDHPFGSVIHTRFILVAGWVSVLRSVGLPRAQNNWVVE